MASPFFTSVHSMNNDDRRQSQGLPKTIQWKITIFLFAVFWLATVGAVERHALSPEALAHRKREEALQIKRKIAAGKYFQKKEALDTGNANPIDEFNQVVATMGEHRHTAWENEPKNYTSPFLYHNNESDPIIDFDGNFWPDWLYSWDSGPRVVEFYAPWCPFCQAFREHYVKFARVVNEIAADMGIDPIPFYAVSCASNRPICKNWKIKGFPQIRLFQNRSRYPITVEYYELHPFEIFDRLGIHLDLNLESVQALAQELKPPVIEQGGSRDLAFPPRTKKELFDDAYLSFDFMIRNSVFMEEGALDEERALVLHIFLELLGGFVPPQWKLSRYIKTILQYYEFAIQSEANMIRLADAYAPQNKEWSYACTKGVPGMGYSCGLWQLLHIYTVGMVEWNSKLSYEHQQQYVVTTVISANFIRDFVTGFLDCEVCRQNFNRAYDNCAFDRCHRLTDEASFEQYQQLPLWLWETHNAVNQRLLREHSESEGYGEPTEDDKLKRRWPAEHDCPKCWREDGTHDPEMIYKFLRVEYWPEDHITAEYRKDIFRGLNMYGFNVTTTRSEKEPVVNQEVAAQVNALPGAGQYETPPHHASALEADVSKTNPTEEVPMTQRRETQADGVSETNQAEQVRPGATFSENSDLDNAHLAEEMKELNRMEAEDAQVTPDSHSAFAQPPSDSGHSFAQAASDPADNNNNNNNFAQVVEPHNTYTQVLSESHSTYAQVAPSAMIQNQDQRPESYMLAQPPDDRPQEEKNDGTNGVAHGSSRKRTKEYLKEMREKAGVDINSKEWNPIEAGDNLSPLRNHTSRTSSGGSGVRRPKKKDGSRTSAGKQQQQPGWNYVTARNGLSSLLAENGVTISDAQADTVLPIIMLQILVTVCTLTAALVQCLHWKKKKRMGIKKKTDEFEKDDSLRTWKKRDNSLV